MTYLINNCKQYSHFVNGYNVRLWQLIASIREDYILRYDVQCYA